MNGRNTMRTAALTLIAAMLAGCSFAPTYERPAAPIPGTWSAASSASAASMQSLHWKDFVIDERLRSRIETALANNRDLRQTLLNVQTARAAYRGAACGPTARSGSRPAATASACLPT
jgi:multidrug efflux system outer membrane protein